MARFNVIAAVLLGITLMGPSVAVAITDADILNFALNLEYLEAEFYSCATTGRGIAKNLRGGGPASIGCQKASLSGDVANIAMEIAADELAHVVFLRTALGKSAVAMPLLDISVGAMAGPFSIAADEVFLAAFDTSLSPPFSPYTNDLFFLLGAFIFEDVGVTAYEGAAAFIQNPAYLTAAAGILAVEAYHAGSVRLQLIERSNVLVKAYDVKVNGIVKAFSLLLNTGDDSGILVDGNASLVPTDKNSITIAHTTDQVVAILTGGSYGQGLFFPNGLNGVINGQPSLTDRKLQSVPDVVLSTRSLMAADSQVTDVNILNFALNLEYLEAEFYSWAVSGHGIPAMYRGNGGHASTGGQKAKLSGTVLALAKDIASDELAHVVFLRAALGAAAVPMPKIDLKGSFEAAANAALKAELNPPFSPYGSNTAFLFGAFIFEDVGVTAYHGAAALISNKAFLTPAAGIMAVEAYHAGAVRTLLFQSASVIVKPYGAPVSAITGAISALRNAASGSPKGGSDKNIIYEKMSNIVPTDGQSLAFKRTPAQVINIAVLGSASGKGGFFPQGLNGAINGTSASIGSVAFLDAKKAIKPKPMHHHHHSEHYHAKKVTELLHMG